VRFLTLPLTSCGFAASGGLKVLAFSLTTKFYKMNNTSNLSQNPSLQQTAVRRSLSSDEILLKEYDYLGKQRFEIGITNFLLIGRDCKMEIDVDGVKLKRISTGVIPREYTSDICSVQIYEVLSDKI
jgi:hypothetical protein